MRVAIVYDRVNKWGGAERVLLALHEIFPEAPLFTSVYSPSNASWASVFPKVISAGINKIKFLQDKHEYIPFLMPGIFENYDFSEYDLVISVTSEAAKGIITNPSTKHICYCLTPTRYLWSGYDDYFPQIHHKVLASPLIKYLRKWDLVASSRPDEMVSISTSIKERIKKYYNRDSQIIFPPLTLNKNKRLKPKKKDSYFLMVTRLVPYKKVDLAIKTFNKLKLPLIIIGKGNQLDYLKSIARSNIHFLDTLTDNELSNYYGRAKALIFPQEEDFGLVALEALSHNTPVIAYKKGGSLDIVTEGKTGVFFDNQTPKDIKYALHRFDKMEFSESEFEKSVKRFSKEKFRENFLKIINNTL